LNPADPRVVCLRAELAAALVSAARVALEAIDIDRSEPLLEEAKRLGGGTELLAALDLELASARSRQAQQRRAQWLLAAQQRLERGAVLEPAGGQRRGLS
jgi:hypothetical protein